MLSLIPSMLLALAPAPAPSIPLCEYEDGSSQSICIWDAKHQGNGIGRSVMIIRGGTNNARYIRISHRLAHRLSH